MVILLNRKRFTTIATIFLAVITLYAVCTASYAWWWEEEEPIGGISVSELEGEARDAYFAMSNASETLTSVTSRGLESSLSPDSFDTLVKDASGLLEQARSSFESEEYNVTIHLAGQATLKAQAAEVELTAHHEMLFKTVLIVAGVIFALIIILPILVHSYHKWKRRKEFIALEKQAARRQHQTQSLFESAVRGEALLPEDLEERR